MFIKQQHKEIFMWGRKIRKSCSALATILATSTCATHWAQYAQPAPVAPTLPTPHREETAAVYFVDGSKDRVGAITLSALEHAHDQFELPHLRITRVVELDLPSNPARIPSTAVDGPEDIAIVIANGYPLRRDWSEEERTYQSLAGLERNNKIIFLSTPYYSADSLYRHTQILYAHERGHIADALHSPFSSDLMSSNVNIFSDSILRGYSPYVLDRIRDPKRKQLLPPQANPQFQSRIDARDSVALRLLREGNESYYNHRPWQAACLYGEGLRKAQGYRLAVQLEGAQHYLESKLHARDIYAMQFYAHSFGTQPLKPAFLSPTATELCADAEQRHLFFTAQ
jgi:hypothetical protein